MLDFTSTPGGLFPRVGKILHITYLLDQYENTLPAAFNTIVSEYASTLQTVGGSVATAADGLVRVASNVMAFAAGQQGTVNAAWDTIVGMVLLDQPSQSWTRKTAMAEVIRQMHLSPPVTVKENTVTVTPTVIATSVGTGVIFTSTKRGDGLVQENTIPEIARIVCTQDSYTGNATQGQEQFSLVGAPSLGGPFDYDWPTGSNAAVQINAISSDVDATANNNLLTNSDFEMWTTGPPDTLNSWTLTGGVWGTDIIRDQTDVYQGTSDVTWIAGTSATPVLYQQFTSTTGSNITPPALSSFGFNVWLKRVGAVSAGVLTVELVNSAGTVVQDAQGVNQTHTITLSALTTSYVSHAFDFRLPVNPPSVLRLRFHMSTALVGANVRMDSAAFAALTAMYVGGPGFTVFSGAVPFVGNDGWSIANTNDFGGATFAATFQSGFERLFGMTQMGLLLPSSASPSIANTLITA